MVIGVLTLHLHIPGAASLKDKRKRLKPLLVRLHRELITWMCGRIQLLPVLW
jgi:uncharacterized protein YlxP (DUF503 family)